MRLAVALLPTLASACFSSPPPQPAKPAILVDFHAGSVPVSLQALAGFDAVDESADLRCGDRVLYGLILRDGADEKHWLVSAEVLEPEVLSTTTTGIAGQAPEPVRVPMTSSVTWQIEGGDEVRIATRFARTCLTVHDAAGTVLGRSTVWLPRDLLRAGFPAACRVDLDRSDFTPDLVKAALESCHPPLLGLLKFLEDLCRDPVLSRYFWQVVRKPLALSMLFGIRTTLHWKERATRATALPAGLPGGDDVWVVPMQVTVNDIAVLDLQILAGTASSPFSISGGVLGLEATHPTDPGISLGMLLLGARRGPEASAADASPKQ